uniref:Inosine triphosphate pyrophosphatase n=1 Tax=Globodera rostochiensis TaxID=31243 RepID=A0A914HCJ2_GLORO
MTAVRKTIKFVSGNKQKLLELRMLLGEDFEIEPLDIDLPELQGEPEYITRGKCAQALSATGGTSSVIVEDTSLCFNALGGLPGPYVKWFLSKLKPEGLYRLLAGYNDKSAYSLCTVAYSEGIDRPIQLFTGTTNGQIVEPKGSREFGWDPCFQPDGFQKTFAEMTKDEKNQISHRAIALGKLKKFLQDEHNFRN